jgi:hypothetical protein
VGLVDPVDEDHVGDAQLVECSKRRSGERRSGRVGIDDDDGKVGERDGARTVGHESDRAGAVDQCEMVAQIIEIVEVELGRAAARARLGAGIADARSIGDEAVAVARPGRIEDSFGKAGFSRAGRSDQRDCSSAVGFAPFARSGMRLSSRSVAAGVAAAHESLEEALGRLGRTLQRRTQWRQRQAPERVHRVRFCVAMANKNTGCLDERGHLADSPRQMPAKAWKDIAKRTWTRTWQDNVGLVAAGVTYYGFLALVPLLGIIVMLYGLFADPQTVVANVRAMTTILPPDVSALIADQLIAAVQTTRETRGWGWSLHCSWRSTAESTARARSSWRSTSPTRKRRSVRLDASIWSPR